MSTLNRPAVAGYLIPPELADLLEEPEPFQAALSWPAELPLHLPFEETVQAAQRDADKHAATAGRDMRYPFLSGVYSAYLRRVLADYALAGAVLAEARSRIEFLEDCLEGGRS